MNDESRHGDHEHGKVQIPKTKTDPKLAPNEVRVESVDEILAKCHDPKKPSQQAAGAALYSLQRQVLLINANQRILQNQHAKLAAAIDRATDTLFDKSDGAGAPPTFLSMGDSWSGNAARISCGGNFCSRSSLRALVASKSKSWHIVRTSPFSSVTSRWSCPPQAWHFASVGTAIGGTGAA